MFNNSSFGFHLTIMKGIVQYIIDAGIDMPPAGVGFYNCVFKGIVNFDESIVPEKSALEYFTMQLLSKC